MSDMIGLLKDEMIDSVTVEIIDQKELAEQLLSQAKEQGVSLVGPGDLLSQLPWEDKVKVKGHPSEPGLRTYS